MLRSLALSVWMVLLTLAISGPTRAEDTQAPPILPRKVEPRASKAPNVAPAPAAKPNVAARKPGQTVKVTEQVRPAFIIDPIVNRIEARRGKTLLLEWSITCEGSPSTLDIHTVALTQDENGTIFPNEKVPAPPELELLTPQTVTLSLNEKFVIKGRLQVPDTNSTFHTFGIIVRDAGQLKAKVDEQKPDGPRVGIKFVTQYLLRCDISVLGVRPESVAKLKIESGELVEVDGVPIARVYVTNPTDGPIEFGMRAQVRASEESESKPTFPLGMPVRANLDPPEKHVGRILAGARLRMESPLAAPVFPGQYYFEASLLGDNKVYTKSGFPVVVTEGDYPAQGIATVLAAPGLLASPSQIELSLQRGGSRAEILTLQNDGPTPLEVEVVAETQAGQPADWLAARPGKVSLAPGTSRKVSVSLAATGDINSHRYARLRLTSKTEGSPTAESTPITVAALGRSNGVATLEAGDLAWDDEHATPAFQIEVQNTGDRHLPLEGQLVLGDEVSRPIEIRGGFGKWILPGTTESLRFKPPRGLPAKKYAAILRIATGENSEPIEKRLEFDLSGIQP